MVINNYGDEVLRDLFVRLAFVSALFFINRMVASRAAKVANHIAALLALVV
jgi:hypothetical protein